MYRKHALKAKLTPTMPRPEAGEHEMTDLEAHVLAYADDPYLRRFLRALGRIGREGGSRERRDGRSGVRRGARDDGLGRARPERLPGEVA